MWCRNRTVRGLAPLRPDRVVTYVRIPVVSRVPILEIK
jgi:hypothetical protein